MPGFEGPGRVRADSLRAESQEFGFVSVRVVYGPMGLEERWKWRISEALKIAFQGFTELYRNKRKFHIGPSHWSQT